MPSTSALSSRTGLTALIFGASGIIGWGITLEALSYPSGKAFKRVIALTSWPLSKEEAFLPADERLTVNSGVDLTGSVEDVKNALQNIEGIENVTHVFFTGKLSSKVGSLLVFLLPHSAPSLVLILILSLSVNPSHNFTCTLLKPIQRRDANVHILTTAVKAITAISSHVEFVLYPGGGKAYGIEFASEIPASTAPKTPFKEDTPRLPSPWGERIFYYAQYDALKNLQREQGKTWNFAEIRPDAVVGFVPNGNAMNVGQNLGLWLSLLREVEGEGAEVVFPASERAWTAKHSDTSQGLVGRFAVFIALGGAGADAKNGVIFNIADGVSTWEEDWAQICALFGLKGVGPREGVTTGKEWVLEHKGMWEGWVRKHGLKSGVLEANDWDFIGFLLGVESDREFDLEKVRGSGFATEMEKASLLRGYEVAFERMRAAKIIP